MFCQDVPQLLRVQRAQSLNSAKLDPTSASSRPSGHSEGCPTALQGELGLHLALQTGLRAQLGLQPALQTSLQAQLGASWVDFGCPRNPEN